MILVMSLALLLPCQQRGACLRILHVIIVPIARKTCPIQLSGVTKLSFTIVKWVKFNHHGVLEPATGSSSDPITVTVNDIQECDLSVNVMD